MDLGERLRNLVGKISNLVSISDKEIDDIIKELQRILLQADVDIDIVFELSENIKKKAKKSLEPGISKREYITKLIYEELTILLGGKEPEILFEPHKILLIGLFGSGKTTTAGKLAYFYKTHGLDAVLVGCDFSRPAAYEQLRQIGEQIGVTVMEGKDMYKISKELDKYKDKIIIIDSAGRDALDDKLISELKEIDMKLNPDEKYLIIPAELGQDAKKQAEKFSKSLNITGIIVTRMDSTARGGATIAACKATKAEVKFITVGEKIPDLEKYIPERFVSRLLGFGDLQTLLEKFRVKEEEVKKITEGELDLNLFYQQLTEMQKHGSIKKILDMIPGFGNLKIPSNAMDVGEEKMKKWKYIIDSMTPLEREKPEIIKSSRIERIAKGSGTNVQEVNELLSNFKKMKKMMKKLDTRKLKRLHGFKELGKLFT
ncbi:MAG: signal recognition particle protein [Candidatus Aenigmarchaeota archaeon ex4484_56]|nr:MAG: signal recognition particle protein [Candidatus Aenigmarchaeota archaeon ex4484_56]